MRRQMTEDDIYREVCNANEATTNGIEPCRTAVINTCSFRWTRHFID